MRQRGSVENPLGTGTHLLNHDSIDAHLLEAAGIVQHVGPAHGQGEHHGGHILLAMAEVQHHRPQHEQRLHKTGGRDHPLSSLGGSIVHPHRQEDPSCLSLSTRLRP